MAKKKKQESRYHKRKDGLLETTRTDRRTGKRIHFYGHTDREIDQQIMEYTSRMERGRLFREVANEWAEFHLPTLAPNTLKGYRPALVRAIDEFGDEPIQQIKPRDVKTFLVRFSRGGRARKTVATQLLVINLICSYAVEESGDLELNPCSNVSIPKNLPKTHREAASPEDEERIKKSADIWLLPYLIMYTGLRKGEALALTKEDIGKDEIRVCKSVYHDSNKPKIKLPKTEAGIRTVPILEPLRKKLPKRFKGYLFSDDGGKTPLTEMQYQKHWRTFVKATGVTATAHQLRHSYATMLHELGIDVKDAQGLLGHSTAAMTQDIYTHIRDNRRQQIAKLLDQKLMEKEGD